MVTQLRTVPPATGVYRDPSAMTLLGRLVLGGLMVAGTAGLGVVVLVLTTPGEQRTQEIAKELEKNPVQWAERRRQNELVMAALKEAAETNENVAWRRTPWCK